MLIWGGVSDLDGDTKIQVEEAADEDVIRFDTLGVERATLSSAGLTLSVPIIDTNGLNSPAQNLLTNSGFKVWSNSGLENVGSQLATNSNFDSGDIGWDKGAGWTIADQGAGDYQLVATNNDGASTTQSVTGLTVGKLYKLSAVCGTFTDGSMDCKVTIGGVNQYGNSLTGTGTSTTTFEADATTMSIGVRTSTLGTDLKVTSITLYEVTPGCVAADALGTDGWVKDAALNTWRQHSDSTYTKAGSFYSLKLTATDGSSPHIYWGYLVFNNKETIDKYKGRTVTVGAFVYATAASTARWMIHDGSSHYGNYHTGAPGWEWIEYTYTLSASLTGFFIAFNVGTASTVYISQPMLVFGSSIGEGNYSSPPGEIVYCEKDIIPTGYDFSAFSDTDAVMNLEALTSGKVPKGAKAVKVAIKLADAAPADTIGVWLGPDTTYTAQDIGDVGAWLHATIAADDPIGTNGWVRCGNTGDIWNYIQASGVGTLDLEIRISAIELP